MESGRPAHEKRKKPWTIAGRLVNWRLIMDENFAIELTDKTDTHQQWLAVMSFGMDTLLKDPSLMMELIAREAERECGRHNIGSRVVADDARHILTELNLRFVVCS